MRRLSLLLLLSACSAASSSSSTVQQTTLTGTFRSMKGVMDPLSCYCYNSGYLSTSNGERIAVCIKDEDVELCTNITVKGAYEKITVASSPNSPCPGGEREIFVIESYTCK
jgi:hypothetical protein